MNPYVILGGSIGTTEAASLGARLTAWHDAMVAHERRLRSGRTTGLCDDGCPHNEARALWDDALATLGSRAHQLTFLRSRAMDAAGDIRRDRPLIEPPRDRNPPIAEL